MSVIFCLRFAHFVLYCGGGGSKKEITALRALRACSGAAPTLVPFEASFFFGVGLVFFLPQDEVLWSWLVLICFFLCVSLF